MFSPPFSSPFEDDELDWNDGGNDTITYNDYVKIDASTVRDYYEIVDATIVGAADPKPVIGSIYTCESLEDSYTISGNTMTIEGDPVTIS